MAQSISKDLNYFITSAVSVFTAFTTWQTLKNQYYIYQHRKKIYHIQNNQVLSVDQLLGKGKKAKDIVLVKGNIGTKDGKQIEKKQGLFSNRERYAVHLSYTEAMYSNDSFQKNNYQLNMRDILKNCIIEGSTKVTLTSEGKDKKVSSILIKNFDQMNYSKVMQVMKWDQKRRSLDVIEHLNAFFLSLLQALITIGSQAKQIPHIKGIQVGKRDIQVGVKIGATVSVLGTIGITTDGELFIEANQIFKDRLSQLSNLRDSLDGVIGKRNIWLLCSVIGGIYLGRRSFKYIKQKNIKVPYINP